MAKKFIGFLTILLINLLCMQVSAQYPVAESKLKITEVSITGIATNSATIKWLTNLESDSLVNYGHNNLLGTEICDKTLSLEHSITLDGLNSATDYYFNITSCDSGGNCVTSGVYAFITSQSVLEVAESEGIDIPEEIKTSEEEIIQEIVEKTGEYPSVIQEKRRGSIVATRWGIYQTYQLGKAKKLLVRSSASKKVLLRMVELLEIKENNIILKIDSKTYPAALGESVFVELDNDGIKDLEIKLVSLPSATTAKFFIKSDHPAVEITGIIFEEEDVFDVPEEYVEEILEEIRKEEEARKSRINLFLLLLLATIAIGVLLGLSRLKKKKGKKF